MIQFKKILVPTDFSKGSLHALGYACELAKKFGAELHLLHVMQDTIIADFEGPYMVAANIIEEMQEEARKQIEALPDPGLCAGTGVTRVVIVGAPFLEILRYAKDNSIDLIVMGTHGRGAVAHVLMGSVAEKVVRKSSCPVLTVRHPDLPSTIPDDKTLASQHGNT